MFSRCQYYMHLMQCSRCRARCCCIHCQCRPSLWWNCCQFSLEWFNCRYVGFIEQLRFGLFIEFVLEILIVRCWFVLIGCRNIRRIVWKKISKTVEITVILIEITYQSKQLCLHHRPKYQQHRDILLVWKPSLGSHFHVFQESWNLDTMKEYIWFTTYSFIDQWPVSPCHIHQIYWPYSWFS